MNDNNSKKNPPHLNPDGLKQTPVTDRMTVSPVTDRLVQPPVTDRMEDSKITNKMEDLAEENVIPLDPLGIKKGELVDDRYRVNDGPLGKYTGEADIFKCIDEITGQTVVLKVYRYNIFPKKDVLNQLTGLNHPDIVSLKAYGTWSGRFYEVMEYCEGGSLDVFMPFSEEELTTYLQEIINGLNYCHDQGIVHRDIKPSNLFFRNHGKKDLVIGDFGISSILENREKVRRTTTFSFITIDYTAPELFGKEKLVGPKTDYYALGITLIHLLTGDSPFQGWDEKSIIAAHITDKIPLPVKLTHRFKQLLEGLMEKSIENRWGYNQVQQWLHGEVVRADDGSVWMPDKYIGKSLPYPGCQKARNPRQLVKYLHEIDAGKDLFRGRISQWVHHFDAKLSDRIIELEENYTDNKELGVIKLRYLLDPTYPLMVLDTPIHNLDELVKVLQSQDSKILAELEKLLWNTHIECWIDATREESRKQELLERIKLLRERLEKSNKKELGLFTLLYMLEPSVPLRFAPDVEITKFEELEDILSKHPEMESTARRFLFESRFEEWLGTTSPDRVEDLQFVVKCREDYQENQDLGFYSFRWYFNPSVPFPFGKEKVTEPQKLAALITLNSDNRVLGTGLLKDGWIRDWLSSTGKLPEPEFFDNVISKPNSSWGRKMEKILHVLDRNLPWPKLACDREAIHLGKVPYDSGKIIPIKFHNAGPGYLAGIILLEDSRNGVSIDRTEIEGKPQEVKITVKPAGLPVGSHQNTVLTVKSNGGTKKIPISYVVSAPIIKMVGRSLLCGILMALVLGLIRFSINDINDKYKSYIIDWMLWKDPAAAPVFILLGIILLAVIGGFIYYLVRTANVEK